MKISPPLRLQSAKCYNVMRSQYLLTNNGSSQIMNNDSSQTITVKFEHCSAIRICTGNT